MAAEFRLAKRPVQRPARDVLGLDIGLGMVAKLGRLTAMAPGPVDAEPSEALVEPPGGGLGGRGVGDVEHHGVGIQALTLRGSAAALTLASSRPARTTARLSWPS